MDIKQMTYIITIAEQGGITKAAEKLFISQSALDQQLLKLERELGIQLFSRSRKNFSLTEAGRVYVDYAKSIVSMRNEAYRTIRDFAEEQRGSLMVAFAPERGMEMFLEVYPRFYERYPEVNVMPREMGVKQQLEMLQNDQLDLGFVAMTQKEIPGLVCTPILSEEFLLITPTGHSLAKLAAPQGAPLAVLEPKQLSGLTLSLMYKESTQRSVIDPIFESNGIRLNTFLETASNRANVAMVQKGMSCSIVPSYYLKGTEGVARFRIAGAPSWNISVCRRRDRHFTKAAKEFARLAEDCFRHQGQE